jgi:putative FmdB family regulatory protein
MPFYEYECSSCKFYTEVMQKISDTPLTKCPSCGKKALKKLVSAPNFRLKGGGWYETDFKGDKENKRNLAGGDKDEPKADATGKPDSKSDAKDGSSKADAKGESAKADSPKADSSKGDSGGGSKGDSSKSDGGSKSGESKGSGSDSRAGSDKRRGGGSRGAKPAARVAASKAKAVRTKSKPSRAKKKARR